MLRTVRASARAISRCHFARVTRCDRLAVIGLKGRRGIGGRWDESGTRSFSSLPAHGQEAAATVDATQSSHDVSANIDSRERAKKLPFVCPGCGAPSQTVDPDSAGYYGSKRVDKTKMWKAQQAEDEIFQKVLQSGALASEVPTDQATGQPTVETPEVPICDRCHYLLYQSKGNSIIHPSMQSIQDIIEESPHKHNHLYHVLDAADFPMSLIPNLQSSLDLPRLRTQNRRSKSMRYIRGRVAELSFIITRSDLLAPQKEQVDSLVPYLRDVLRDALGRNAKNIRLGNVRCVSAKRGWWTKTVKEDIWSRGGAGWMVGKVNVGKSALYEVVFPKGRKGEDTDIARMRSEEQRTLERGMAMLNGDEPQSDVIPKGGDSELKGSFAYSPAELSEGHKEKEVKPSDSESFQESELQLGDRDIEEDQDDTFFDEDETSLLPPAQPEVPYPHLPLVASLPGTTASPIRIPFGNGKGELIDLPGIHRTSLDTHIKPEHHKDLVMKSRIVPQQYTIKPGQSLLIGGLIRITPKTDDLVFLAYPFVPLKAHITSHEKATAIQTGVTLEGIPYDGTVESIATDFAKQSIKPAGTFQLKWDVTKRRAGPLTDKAAGKQKAANLPFTVYSADILIESVGWIELVCQVRRRGQRKSFITESVSDAFGEATVKREVETVPEVEVWSPGEEFVGVRQPMGAWLLGGPKREAKHKRRLRPRQSMSFARRKAGGALGGTVREG